MTINVNVSVSIATQTQQFLREIVKVYTPADLQDLADLEAKLVATKAKIDVIDPPSNPKGTNP